MLTPRSPIPCPTHAPNSVNTPPTKAPPTVPAPGATSVPSAPPTSAGDEKPRFSASSTEKPVASLNAAGITPSPSARSMSWKYFCTSTPRPARLSARR